MTPFGSEADTLKVTDDVEPFCDTVPSMDTMTGGLFAAVDTVMLSGSEMA